MPRSFLFTKEEITRAALELTRERGFSAISARTLGEKLGTSSRPIFSQFKNMEEVQRSVIEAADGIYNNYIASGMADGRYPPYKASGMAYIRFAREEKELFKLLFMRDRSGEKIPENREQIRPLIELIMKQCGISEDDAYRFHLEEWIYVHGIATMIATSYLEWDEEMVSTMLTDSFTGLKLRYTAKNR